ncbi:MAG: putative toxin-antitoxin system toxin component, PIN family [Syntrophomonadaceae bacterium]|nr:putative toxin-antitoxin system toxin component, PIN family [Syntrophomonadaceae bacterium]
MRIMLDTNILISAIVLNSLTLNKMIEKILNEDKLVLSSYVVSELKQVVNRRFKNKMKYVDEFLMAFPFELVYTPDIIQEGLFEIRDEMDYPVLYTAIIEDVDILITGDKDFGELKLEKPKILTPREFIDEFC